VPKISIIIPVHDMQDHLTACLDSVVNQTLADLEFICIDDHSTDSSGEILAAYAQRDPRFRVITYPDNRTASQARKDGVSASTGDYILFLDADDRLAPHACERLYAEMDSDPVDILHFGTVVHLEPGVSDGVGDWLRSFLAPFDSRVLISSRAPSRNNGPTTSPCGTSCTRRLCVGEASRACATGASRVHRTYTPTSC
jgi:glycosyltransferase involved in cell wall biosynthesis